MKKIVIPGLFVFICIVLIQCFEESPAPTYSQAEGYNDLSPSGVGGGNSSTVTPNAPAAHNSRGFQPQAGTDTYSVADQEDDQSNPDNDDPLYKSDNIRNREGRWGISAPVMNFNSNTLEDFRLGRSFRSRDIRNMRIYVDLEKAAGSYYQGKVTLSYNDAGNRTVPFTEFSSGSDENAQYNVWFRAGNKKVFHGFFQENEGSLILVVDRQTRVLRNADDNNNNNPDNLRGGSIWIMMFRTTFRGATSCSNHSQLYVSDYNDGLQYGVESLPLVSQLPVKCWFKRIGPYDCRTWRTDRGVDTFRAVEPDDNCYAKLGDFEGLDITEAFSVRNFSNLAIH